MQLGGLLLGAASLVFLDADALAPLDLRDRYLEGAVRLTFFG